MHVQLLLDVVEACSLPNVLPKWRYVHFGPYLNISRKKFKAPAGSAATPLQKSPIFPGDILVPSKAVRRYVTQEYMSCRFHFDKNAIFLCGCNFVIHRLSGSRILWAWWKDPSPLLESMMLGALHQSPLAQYNNAVCFL
jgi:hypothetical protein